MSTPLDAAAMKAAAGELATRDVVLARLLEANGVPPLWLKGPGFETLVDIVLGQQVSLSSARTALERVRAAAGGVTPGALAGLGEEGLRAAGQTRQKARYLAGLASAALSGSLDLARIDTLLDPEVIDALTAHTGVGRWTADIYLLMGLGRPDVWASTDLALVVGARSLWGLGHDASAAAIADGAQAWRPYRSVAARMVWQAYLIERGRPLD
ncbi:MAG: DNA-3-methyladenine glycosylase 2 family protein [Chloroflexi bacterium]|nr:DNA-3-methyladenine glycosylase 2 family protein [Chloroflexota bacterium]